MPLGKLPKSGRTLWESVYKEARKSGDSEEIAARKAWASVKAAGWKKDKEGNWKKKSESLAPSEIPEFPQLPELIETFSMYVTKATSDGKTMRWAATNSDTDYDSYKERMSLELYKDFIAYIEREKELPQAFKSLVYSDFWKGGMPYLSISHYPDLNGKAVPGEPLEIFIDGNKLKAKGILFNNSLGHAVYRSLKEDKNKQPEEKIRISIGFLDLAHKHGENGNIWVRESAYALCPECLQGAGDKIYVQGCLVHLALTRVPVNKRTEMVLEEKADMAKKKTRKEDAESIVGKDEADKIEMAQRASQQRSDILIEMSETEEETRELIAEAEAAEESAEVAEVTEEEEEEEEEKEEVLDPVVEEAHVEKSDDSLAASTASLVEHLPYGGAVSMRQAEEYVAAKNEAIYLMDMWQVFSNVIWNIMERSDVLDKRAAMNQAVDEFKNVLAEKAMLTFSEITETTKTEEHALKPAIDALLEKVDNSIGLVDIQKAEILNPALQELGTAITDYLKEKSVVQNDEPPAQINILDEMKELLQPLSEGLKTLSDRMGVLEAKSNTQNVEVRQRIPQSRTLTQAVVVKAQPETPKPNSLKDIARKSVGL